VERALESVFSIVKASTGHDFSSYKVNTVLRRIERRMAAHELSGVGQLDRYLKVLEEHPLEAQALCQEILIGVTGFFRDPEAFALLEREIIPQLFARRDADQAVRIWHPACATGEEVYSLAMLVREYLDAQRLEVKVQFFASDLDEAAITQARVGCYRDDVAGEVGQRRLKEFFTRVNDGWQVSRQIREMVVFAHHSLIKDPPFSKLDLLVCRNLLIYLAPDLQDRLINLFHQVLRPGGFLFLGAAETVGRSGELFRTVDKKWKVFQRLEGARRCDPLFPLAASLRRPLVPGRAARPAAPQLDPLAAAHRLLAERYAPPCVVVNERYQVVHLSSRVDRFLRVPAGEPTRDILKMAREELRPPLRAAVYKALADNEPTVFRAVQVGSGGERVAVNLLVEPLGASPSGRLALVIFEEARPQETCRESEGRGEPAAGDGGPREFLIRQLEEQLRVTHEQLQATTEQLESSHEGFLSANEELMSINEEFQSANEELQSTNEELETSQEELQSLNEELVTVNAELQGKVEELYHAKNDLENLLTSSQIPTLFLDPGLHIKRFTPAMAAIFNLMPSDLDRPFRHLAGTIDWSELARDAQAVLADRLPVEREVTASGDGRHYLMRVLPYRTTGGATEGIVVTLLDLTERRRAEEALRNSKQAAERHLAQLQAILDHLSDGVVIADLAGNVFHWNPAALAMHGFGCLEECRQSLPEFARIFELATEEEGVLPVERWPLSRILAGETLRDLEVRVRRHSCNWSGVFNYGGTLARDQEGRPVLAVVSVVDITHRKRAEDALRQSELRFRTLADAIPQLCWIADADGWIFWYNRRWYEYTGTTPAEMDGWGWQTVHDPEVLPSVLERWQESIASGKPFDMVFPLRGADGVFRPFLTRILPLYNEDGKVARWFGTNTDIAEQLGVEQALLHGNLRLNLLAKTAGQLLASESPQEEVNSICREVMSFLDCQAFFNFLLDEEEGRLRLNACAGIPAEEVPRIEWLEVGTAVCGCAARDACRIVAEDILNSDDPRAELVRSFGIQAYACHPLIAQGQVLGTLSFGTRTRTAFSEDELAVMKAVADQVAIAMERRRMEEALRKAHGELEQRVRLRTEELASAVEALLGENAERERAETSLRRLNRLYAVLSETNQAIVRAADRESLFRDFCRIATEQGGFLLAWVGVLGEDGRVGMVAASGATGYLDDIRISVNHEPAGEGPTGISVREGTYYICNDFQHDPCTAPWHERGRAHGIHSSASIVLKEEGRVVGSLTLYAGQPDFFDQEQVALLRQMGTDISFALDNLLREKRRRAAEQALQEETLERLRAVEALREKERMLIQQSRQAAMGEMIGNIAHQWRQPLNALGLMVQELAMSYELGDFSQKYLDDSVKSAMQVISHMSQTIDDFRNFFLPEKEKSNFEVGHTIHNAVAIIEASLKRHRIAVELNLEGNPVINGYPNEYSQVLLNLLLNARDALTERKIEKPRIAVRLCEREGRSVVTVSDNAGGIAPDIIEKIFDPYFTTKGPEQGTGVGLYMSKAIVEKNMNGRLTVMNSQAGAEFRIEV